MPRYFLTLAYQGTDYCGWQRQPNAPSVQETLEAAAAILLRHPVEITGCGRTDTGVHAAFYVAHFDAPDPLPSKLVTGLNGILPKDIVIHDLQPVADTAHARFDAIERSYRYDIATRRDPFARETTWFFPHFDALDLSKMQSVADLLPQFDAFFPFCKAHSGVDHYRCAVTRAHWEYRPSEHRLSFHITANRFLRGMVRLLVGASIQTGRRQIAVADIREALEQQKALPKNLSVPPTGLFLTDVRY